MKIWPLICSALDKDMRPSEAIVEDEVNIIGARSNVMIVEDGT